MILGNIDGDPYRIPPLTPKFHSRQQLACSKTNYPPKIQQAFDASQTPQETIVHPGYLNSPLANDVECHRKLGRLCTISKLQEREPPPPAKFTPEQLDEMKTKCGKEMDEAGVNIPGFNEVDIGDTRRELIEEPKYSWKHNCDSRSLQKEFCRYNEIGTLRPNYGGIPERGGHKETLLRPLGLDFKSTLCMEDLEDEMIGQEVFEDKCPNKPMRIAKMIKIAGIKEDIYNPALPTLRKYDMDNVNSKLDYEHCQQSTRLRSYEMRMKPPDFEWKPVPCFDPKYWQLYRESECRHSFASYWKVVEDEFRCSITKPPRSEQDGKKISKMGFNHGVRELQEGAYPQTLYQYPPPREPKEVFTNVDICRRIDHKYRWTKCLYEAAERPNVWP